MTASYALRLVCVSLAVLLLVNAGIAAMVAMAAPAVIRRAEQWRAESASRMMFTLRMLPPAAALFVVFAICVPSYLRLEPEAMEEEIGLACLTAAALGAAAWGFSLARTARAMFRSRRYRRSWRGRGAEMTAGGERVWMIDGGRTLALAGIFRPELIVSREIVEALPPDQLAAALRHEQAHAGARDNFKRLLMLLAPGAAFCGPLERAWARFTEWAADDGAAEGDQDRSVALAAALVRVARMGSMELPPLGTALMANAGDLQVRVERLLQTQAEARSIPRAWLAAFAATAVALVALALHPATVSIAYGLLERLID